MARLFIPYRSQLQIPEYTSNDEPVTFGIELEGLGDWRTFNLNGPIGPEDEDVPFDFYADILRRGMQNHARVPLAMSVEDFTQHRGWNVKGEEDLFCERESPLDQGDLIQMEVVSGKLSGRTGMW